MRLAPALLAAAVAVAGCSTESSTTTAAANRAGRQCVFIRDVQNFEAVDDQTINIRAGVNDIYQLKLFAPCHEARFAQGVAVRGTGGTDQICNPLDAELVFRSPTGPERCMLNDIRRLTPAEVAALDPKFKP
jgi:hypothetical protein